MFGVDIGITVSSITCITAQGKIIDFFILFGHTEDKNEWRRITTMADAIVDNITTMVKAKPNVLIRPYVAIEEPVFPYRTKNPRSYFCMCCLYALIKNKLMIRGYRTWSIHPLSAKAIAKKLAFKKKKLSKLHMVRGSLTKKGMVRAFKKVVGHEPDYRNAVGRETLADSYFIAQTGLDKKRLGIK